MPCVLVVDDDHLVAEIVSEALMESGHEVVTAHSAVEAASCLAREPRSFAAVVTDVDLGPGGNGFDVGRQARALNPDVHVAYMTGNPANLRRCQAESSLMFPKPFRPHELVERIGRLLDEG